MFVSVIHRISDPDRFSQLSSNATIPEDLRLPQVISAADRATTVCLWETPSVHRLREFLEPLTAGICKNEYAEVDTGSSMGLPAAVLA